MLMANCYDGLVKEKGKKVKKKKKLKIKDEFSGI
jgi:hypothetical protein